MGGSLFMQERDYASLGEATAFAAGSGIGWWLAIILMAAIVKRSPIRTFRSVARRRHHLHFDRSDGNRFYDIHGSSVVVRIIR